MNLPFAIPAVALLSRRAELFRADRCIIGPDADFLFFWGCPLLAVMFTYTWVGVFSLLLPVEPAIGGFVFAATALTYAHLLPVFLRSHLNADIFAAHRTRLTVGPVLLLLALIFSKPAFIVAGVVGAFWDIYHSAQQNFGLARIYDMKAGNPGTTGRWLDRMISHVLYVGPIAAGASLVTSLDPLKSLKDIGWQWLTTAPELAVGHAGGIRGVVVVVSLAAWLVYVAGQWRLSQQGYNVSPQKVALMASTALASILGWGMSSPLVAIASMNIFHAVQYFALVWKTEGEKAPLRLGVQGAARQKAMAFVLVFAIPAVFGIANASNVYAWNVLSAVYVTVSLLHFWMDGFIWSVRRKAV